MSANTKAAPGANVAVLGASQKPERYSNRAVKMLASHGFHPIPVNPAGLVIEGIESKRTLAEISERVDTLTMYVGPEISANEYERIIALAPRRVIFNPGSENPELMQKLRAAGIEVVEGCTLVMLGVGAF